MHADTARTAEFQTMTRANREQGRPVARQEGCAECGKATSTPTCFGHCAISTSPRVSVALVASNVPRLVALATPCARTMVGAAGGTCSKA